MADKIMISRRNFLPTGGYTTVAHVEALYQRKLVIYRTRYFCRLRMYTGCRPVKIDLCGRVCDLATEVVMVAVVLTHVCQRDQYK